MMTVDQIKDMVCLAVDAARAGDPSHLDRLARHLDNADRARRILRGKGYGVAGMSLSDMAREVP